MHVTYFEVKEYMHQYRYGADLPGNSSEEKDVGMLVGKFTMKQQYIFVAKMANSIQG